MQRIGTLLDGHGEQLPDTSRLLWLVINVLQQAPSAQLASVLSAMQEDGVSLFLDHEAQGSFD